MIFSSSLLQLTYSLQCNPIQRTSHHNAIMYIVQHELVCMGRSISKLKKCLFTKQCSQCMHEACFFVNSGCQCVKKEETKRKKNVFRLINFYDLFSERKEKYLRLFMLIQNTLHHHHRHRQQFSYYFVDPLVIETSFCPRHF